MEAHHGSAWMLELSSVTAQLPSTAVHSWDSWGRKRNALNHNFVTESYSNQYEETVSVVVRLIQGWPLTLRWRMRLMRNAIQPSRVRDYKQTNQQRNSMTEWKPTSWKHLVMYKNKKMKSNGRAVILKADRSLFGCIMVISQRRNLHNYEDILLIL